MPKAVLSPQAYV